MITAIEEREASKLFARIYVLYFRNTVFVNDTLKVWDKIQSL